MLTYAYGSSGANNGQISGITDGMDSGRTASYSYDSLGRLSSASTAGSSSYPAWGLAWTYDRYGNRTAQSIASGCSGITCPTNSITVSTTTNRVTDTGYAYNSAGNMTGDGYNTLTYDAAARQIASSNGSSSGAYAYDGKGMRVKKCVPNCSSPTTTTVYIFSGGKVLAEYDNGAAVGSPSREYIYSGATQIAKIVGATTTYYHQDHLSNRLVTNSSGTVVEQMGHHPYGEDWYDTGSDKWKFTSYERDAETGNGAGTGNDYAMARYNVNRLGRFSSPDPLSGSLANPQSLNHYTYVGNDPINAADPTGQSDVYENCGAGPGFYDQTCGAESWVLSGGKIGSGIDFGSDGDSLYTYGDYLRDNPSPDDPGKMRDPCQPGSTTSIPGDIQRAEASVFGLAITEIQFAASGDVSGFNVVIGPQPITTSGVTFAAGSSIFVSFNVNQLSLSAVGGNITINQPNSSLAASISSLTFANGAITSLSGNATAWGISIPFTSGSVMDKLNQDSSAVAALSGLSSGLSKCAGSR